MASVLDKDQCKQVGVAAMRGGQNGKTMSPARVPYWPFFA